jgi:hypothetical protein
MGTTFPRRCVSAVRQSVLRLCCQKKDFRAVPAHYRQKFNKLSGEKIGVSFSGNYGEESGDSPEPLAKFDWRLQEVSAASPRR